MKRLLFVTIISFFILAGCNSSNTGDKNEKQATKPEIAKQTEQKMQNEEQPAATNQTQQNLQEPNQAETTKRKGTKVLIITPFGDMTALLYDETPQHRDNFLKLARSGFYDGTLFHRVIRGFMIQGGDPDSRDAAPGQRLGMGGPGYTIPAEFNPEFIHKKGALAAARTGGPSNPEKRSSGSQFYIVQGQKQNAAELNRIASKTGAFYTGDQIQLYQDIGGTPSLDNDYTVFGEVIEGLEVIDMIASVRTAPGDRPLEDVSMRIKVLD